MDKKLKKKLLQERNRKQLLINQQARQHQEERERADEEDRRIRESLHAEAASPDGEVWSARVQEIRNRLNGKKRMARDRWNRYSGTSDAGAMGR
jgi:hypothetical protein